MKKAGIYREHVPELIKLWRKSVERLWRIEGQVGWYNLTMRQMLIHGTLLRRYQIQPEGIVYAGVDGSEDPTEFDGRVDQASFPPKNDKTPGRWRDRGPGASRELGAQAD